VSNTVVREIMPFNITNPTTGLRIPTFSHRTPIRDINVVTNPTVAIRIAVGAFFSHSFKSSFADGLAVVQNVTSMYTLKVLRITHLAIIK
jgi:hypothetical protein